MARDCVLVVLLLCTICSVSVQANTPDILKLNETLSGEANKKLQEVFEMMKNKNWMERLVKAISTQKSKMAAKKPQETAEEKIEDTIKQAKQQQQAASDALRPAHKVVGKLNKEVLPLTNSEVNDGSGLRRAKRSEPENPQRATEATPQASTQQAAQNTITNAAASASSSNTAALTPSASSLSAHTAGTGNAVQSTAHEITTSAHLGSTTSQEYDWGLLPCPEHLNHCVYGDCVGLGYEIYTCYCWEGYSGMSCELLEIDRGLAALSTLSGSSNPAQAALGSPSAYSAATAIAHYLAGDLQGFQ